VPSDPDGRDLIPPEALPAKAGASNHAEERRGPNEGERESLLSAIAHYEKALGRITRTKDEDDHDSARIAASRRVRFALAVALFLIQDASDPQDEIESVEKGAWDADDAPIGWLRDELDGATLHNVAAWYAIPTRPWDQNPDSGGKQASPRERTRAMRSLTLALIRSSPTSWDDMLVDPALELIEGAARRELRPKVLARVLAASDLPGLSGERFVKCVGPELQQELGWPPNSIQGPGRRG